MGNVRLFLWAGLAAILWLNYTVYVQDNQPAPAPVAQHAQPSAANAPSAADVELQPPQQENGTPSVPSNEAQKQTGGLPIAAGGAPAKPIHVQTDVYDIVIDPRGGNIVDVDLPEYPVEKDKPNVPVELITYDPKTLWAIQTGLKGLGSNVAPDGDALYHTASRGYRLQPGQDKLVVTLGWTSPDGVRVDKVFTFTRGSYAINVSFHVDNAGSSPWKAVSYARMLRRHVNVEHHMGDVATYSFKGPVLYNGDHFNKIDFDDLAEQPIDQTVTHGWLAGIEHHFVSAIVPPRKKKVRYTAKARNGDWILTAVTPATTLAPGQSQSFPFTVFVGPKLQNQLQAVGDNLQRTVDYGILSVVAQPLFKLLAFIESYTGNWGWAIIIVTILIRLALYKFTAMSGRSMAKMRKLQPRMKAIKERYKDDRQAQSQATMELYKKEKVNPAAGCLPMVIQLPILYAWYWVLIESVEIRQAPFMFWINDLTARDPYYILPVLMGAAMYFQMRLSPTTADPMQAKIMQFMPLVMTVFFAMFPSGLVLYYLTNTLLGLLQQWHINRVVAREDAAVKT